MNEIVYFFRKMLPGAYSINQIFEALAAEIGKNLNVRKYELSDAGASPSTIAANIAAAKKAAGSGIHHITGDVHYVALGLRRRRTVLTIHDCVILARTPRWHPKFYAYLWFWYKLPIQLADAVTTISQKSKDEIVAFTGCHPDKIKVIPNFVNGAFRHSPKTFNADCPRILQIGTKPNKNLERVVEALSGIDCILEIIGNLSQSQIELLAKSHIKYENLMNLTQSELAERYRLADIVVFVSTYEGFGLPIVEAQSTGRPVVTSDLQPMTWVAGEEGACFVNPNDTNAIKAGVLKVIEDADYQVNLVQNGLENTKRFSLQRVAQQYLDVYEAVSRS